MRPPVPTLPSAAHRRSLPAHRSTRRDDTIYAAADEAFADHCRCSTATGRAGLIRDNQPPAKAHDWVSTGSTIGRFGAVVEAVAGPSARKTS